MARRSKIASGKRRILLAEDHAIVREGLVELINDCDDLEVCGEACSAPEAVIAVAELMPDLVIVDLSLRGGTNGLDLIKDLKALHPNLRMIVLSMHDEEIYAGRALRAGAQGYVMKHADSRTLLQALRTVLNGEVFLSEAMQGRMLQQFVGTRQGPSTPKGVEQLSDRELQVFQLLGEGQTTREIAHKLNLSLSTVETHRAHVKQKLNLQNASELMRRAVEWVTHSH